MRSFAQLLIAVAINPVLFAIILGLGFALYVFGSGGAVVVALIMLLII